MTKLKKRQIGEGAGSSIIVRFAHSIIVALGQKEVGGQIFVLLTCEVSLDNEVLGEAERF